MGETTLDLGTSSQSSEAGAWGFACTGLGAVGVGGTGVDRTDASSSRAGLCEEPWGHIEIMLSDYPIIKDNVLQVGRHLEVPLCAAR